MKQVRTAVAVLVLALVVIAVIWMVRGSAAKSSTKTAAGSRSGSGSAAVNGEGGGGRDGKVPALELKPTAALPAPANGAIIKAKWGGATGELGNREAHESNPEGPMAIVANKNGMAILDQVNARVSRYDKNGKLIGTFTIGPDTAQDLALGPNGQTAVLDRHDEGQVLNYDADGNLLGQAPVVGGPIAEAGAATGIFSDGTGTYVEREHGEVIRVLGPGGQPDPDRPSAPGRPLRDGVGFIQALIADKGAGLVTVREFSETGDLVWQRTVRFPAPLITIVLLDSDMTGRVFLGAHIALESPNPPYELTQERIVVAGMAENDGSDRGSLAIPPPNEADEAMRPLTVGDDGTIYQMTTTPEGVEVHSYQLPSQ